MSDAIEQHDLLPTASLGPRWRKRISELPIWLRLSSASLLVSAVLNGSNLIASILQVSDASVSVECIFTFIHMLALIWGLAFFASLAGSVIGPVLMLRRSERSTGFGILVAALVFFVSFYLTAQVLGAYRSSAFQRLAERSAPLVAAIHRYHDDIGRPPANLRDLVPVYISSIPNTGMAAYPTYSYSVEPEFFIAQGNSWQLWVDTPSAALDFDRFIYVPSLNYPVEGESGFYERIGDWAYYHE